MDVDARNGELLVTDRTPQEILAAIGADSSQPPWAFGLLASLRSQQGRPSPTEISVSVQADIRRSLRA
ncbi:MAG: hypothetical protein N2556_00590 [Anaerolineae bacterium]|nr:hypothetical protein [Anaerolineae bacterium]